MEVNREAIKKQRRVKGWTQQHLADASGLSLRTIQRLEKEGNAAKETVMAICASLEIQREELSVIPQVDPSQLQPVDVRIHYLAVLLATVAGACAGALLTYFFVA